MYLNIEHDFLHNIYPFRESFGHFLHAVVVLHRLFDISVLLEQLELTYKKMEKTRQWCFARVLHQHRLTTIKSHNLFLPYIF